jgi:signal transduction histidine kinase/DNA-binding response OmpR family regulator
MKKNSSTTLIISGFLLVLSMLGGIIYISLDAINTNSKILFQVVHEQGESEDIYRMTEAANNRALMLFRMAAIENPFDRDDVFIKFKEQAGDFIKARQSLLSQLEKDGSVKYFNWDELQPLVIQGSDIQNQVTDLILEDHIGEAHAMMLNEVIPTQDAVIAGLKEMLNAQRDVINVDLGTATQNTQTAYLLILSIGIPALIIGLSITVYVTRQNARTEATILEQKEIAESANNAKSQFLANMSHEIRTPLTAIIGFADTLLDKNTNVEDRRKATETIIRNGKHLHQVINDVLDLSKIEAGQLEIENLPTSLGGVISEIESIVGMKARDKGLEFLIDYKLPLPTHITTDPVRLKQILINLCSNAIKFTANGSVTLSVEYLEYLNQRGKVVFSVTDTGIGMTTEEMANIFQPFSQADTSTTRKYGGTGLGLCISHQLAEKLGGSLSCKSEKGKGSTFTAIIDAGHVDHDSLTNEMASMENHEAISENSTKPKKLAGHVLLAEDSPDNQRLVKLYIDRAGARLTIVENGQQAVEAGLSGDYDLILMDTQMPIMDGVEATNMLRIAGYRGPIVSLTANAMKSDRDKCLKAGANDYLNKPIDLSRFYTVLAEYLPRAGSNEARSNTISSDDTMETSKTTAPSLYDDPEFKALIEQFLQNLPDMVDEMDKAVEQEDWTVVQSVTHKLKGMGGAFGFPLITEQAASVNNALKNQDIEPVPGLTKHLVTTCQDIISEHQRKSA